MTSYAIASSLFVITALSCRPSAYVGSTTDVTIPDSLHISISCMNLSENMTANDEVLIACYVEGDSSQRLDDPIFLNKFYISAKNPARSFQSQLDKNAVEQSWLLVLIELDSDLPVDQVDSVFRINHHPILNAFNTRDYSMIEKYFGDDDILGYKIIPKLNYNQRNIYDFVGRYKLDKYEYRVIIQNGG